MNMIKGRTMQDFRTKTFLTVCKTLNFTRAAEELHISQPAVSQHIAHLEQVYGAKLFSYGNRKLSLTQAGRMLESTFLTMAHDETMLHDRIRALVSNEGINLRIGMTLTAGEYVVAPALADALAKNQEFRISVHSGDTARLLSLLNEGAIDCAFIEGIFDATPYTKDRFSEEELVCICSPDTSIAHAHLGLEDLLHERLFVRESGSGTRAVFEHALTERNASLEAFENQRIIESLDIIKIFVAKGLGISFVYRSAVEKELESGALATVSIKRFNVHHDISFIRLKNSAFEQELERFFSILKS